MHIRIRFSKNQCKKLQALQNEARTTASVTLFRRTTAILMLATYSITHQEVADTLGVCREVIGRWLAIYLSKGPSALRPRKSSGRKNKLTKAQRKELFKQISAGPKKCGYPGGVWTSAMIQEHIHNKFGVLYSVKYIPEYLRGLGLSHIKPKHSFKMTREQVKDQIRWVRKNLPDLYEKVTETNGVLLFQDESTFQLQSNVSATWAPKGKPPVKVRNPQRGNFKVLGTMELFTGKFIYSIQDKRLVSKEFAKFLRQVAKHYKGRQVYIVLDGATYHGGQAVRDFLEKNKNVHLVKLPVKSPNLNPIEKVWKELKKDLSHNVYFKNKAALKKTLSEGLRKFQQDPTRIRSLMGKWENAVKDRQGCLEGKYDPSLVPETYQNSIWKIRQEVAEELRM